MLVTIVALGILLVLLMPSFHGVRSASRQIGCSIQLKRITDGLNQHADDNEGLYTIAGGVVPWEQIDPETRQPSWMQQVVPYLSSKKVFAGCGAYPLTQPLPLLLGRSGCVH